MNVEKLQREFLLKGIAIAPALPFLYLQGQFTRLKVGKLPDAQGPTTGTSERGGESINFLAIGESTIAGVGASDHDEALTGQFARALGEKTGKSVKWHALGVSGITIKRTIAELVPKIPDVKFDSILIALGGNDVFGLSTPVRFRRNLSKLIGLLREQSPSATIFLANVPMVRDFIALPQPLKYVLSRVAKMHHFNAIDLVSGLEQVYYYEPQGKFIAEHFSDGVHPSPLGYRLWADEMIAFFSQKDAI